jgi:hypothetical protein
MRVKTLTVLGIVILFSMTAVYAQKTDTIMTVEEAYLNSVEGVIINELATADGRDNKMVALQYIETAIDAGRKTEDIQVALASLSSEGINSVVRESNRTMNNYPDVRMKACELLGKMGTEEAKDTLVAVMYSDNEPSVIMSAVKSLGEIGINENDEVIEMINWITRKFDIILPTSSLALEILNSYEKLAPTVQNKSGMIENIIRIASNYNYVTPVRNRAYEVLKSVSGNGSKDSKNGTAKDTSANTKTTTATTPAAKPATTAPKTN